MRHRRGRRGLGAATPARRPIRGIDRNPWAVAEATWTYRQLGLAGRAAQRDVSRAALRGRRGTAVVVAYTANELTDDGRAALLDAAAGAATRSGARVLVIEPIARAPSPWWRRLGARVVRRPAAAPTSGAFRPPCRRGSRRWRVRPAWIRAS